MRVHGKIRRPTNKGLRNERIWRTRVRAADTEKAGFCTKQSWCRLADGHNDGCQQ